MLNKLKLSPIWDKLDFTEKGLLITIIINNLNNSIVGYIENEDEFLNILNIKKSKLTYDLKFDKDVELDKFLNFNFSGIMLEAIRSIYETDLNSNNIIHAKLSYDDFVYYLWENKWKKNIFLFFEPITKELQKEYTFLKGKKGFFSKLLYNNNITLNESTSTTKTIKPKKKRTKKVAIELDTDIYDFINNNLINNSICFLNNKPTFLTYAKVFNIVNSENALQQEENNYNIWTVGVNMLSNNLYEKDKSRKKIAVLKNKYGVENLSKVIAEVSLLKNKPADVYPLLIKKLKDMEKGNISKEEKESIKIKRIASGIIV